MPPHGIVAESRSDSAAAWMPPRPLAHPPEGKAITEIDMGYRLIKVQVFLWKGGQDWTELWDVDGKITPP
jgi:hypothetical protein